MNHSVQDEAALRRSVRTLLTVADNVRRGTLPARALQRIVPAEVAADIVAELPPSPGASTVNTVFLQQPTPTRTYFTGSAVRPDGSAVAYLGLIARTGEHDPWRVTQVLPVSEHTIGRAPNGRVVAPDPDRVASFRNVITSGYLDASVELLGAIPQQEGQRYDWLEAAAAILHHARAEQLQPGEVVSDLERDAGSS
ncbi:MAG: hypothetical protein KY434_11295, partial [Actinobacteria bacterium]|nr:hypothetical protein [Actinomycetota bacterium]